MALTKPILYSVSAFDATEQYVFNFNVIGGDQVVKNKLTITDQTNNIIIYDEIQTTFAYRHILPANTLTNGQYYSAIITTYNSDNDESLPSSGIQFYCFTTPTFDFNNIPNNHIINNASYNFTVRYDQNENEMLNSYIFNLYDSERSLLKSSSYLYVGGITQLPILLNYLFSGMNNDTIYYVQALGETIHGIKIDTGLILINIKYTTPNVFSIIELNNNCEGGYITIKSNLVNIIGNSIPDPPIYVDDNTAVDVTGEGDYIIWNNGYEINGDFTASLWGYDFNDNSTIISMTDGYGQILRIRYWKDENNFYYAELIVEDSLGSIIYYIYSNPVFIYPNDQLQIWFRRIGYLYEIGLYDLTARPTLRLNSSSEGLIGVNILG